MIKSTISWKRELRKLSNQLEKLNTIEKSRFKKVFPKNKKGRLEYDSDVRLPDYGVYFVFNNKRLIYIGTITSRKRKLHQRIHDICHKSGSHTLFRQLENRYHSETRNFIYNKCSFIVLKTNEIPEAKRLEKFSIAIFDPKYNQETKEKLND